jgi:hypothetical protein
MLYGAKLFACRLLCHQTRLKRNNVRKPVTDNNEFLVLSLQYTCHSVTVTVLTQIFIAFQEYQLPDSQAFFAGFHAWGVRESVGVQTKSGSAEPGTRSAAAHGEAVLGVGAGGVAPPATGVRGYNPGKFLK